MSGDQEMADTLEEYGGYCISGDVPRLQKAMVLLGSGANGKSVFLDVLQAVAGKANYSTVMARDLGHDTKRYSLVGKLFNVSEEVHRTAFTNTDILKALINGGSLRYKKLYSQPFETKVNTKLIMAANELPPTEDRTDGFFRRHLS